MIDPSFNAIMSLFCEYPDSPKVLIIAFLSIIFQLFPLQNLVQMENFISQTNIGSKALQVQTTVERFDFLIECQIKHKFLYSC